MITDQSPDVKTQKMFKKQSVVGHNVKFETNRIVLAETKFPEVSSTSIR